MSWRGCSLQTGSRLLFPLFNCKRKGKRLHAVSNIYNDNERKIVIQELLTFSNVFRFAIVRSQTQSSVCIPFEKVRGFRTKFSHYLVNHIP